MLKFAILKKSLQLFYGRSFWITWTKLIFWFFLRFLGIQIYIHKKSRLRSNTSNGFVQIYAKTNFKSHNFEKGWTAPHF